MEHLTEDQKIACRHSPLAAYLARRLPHLLTWVAILTSSNLVVVLLAAAFALSPDLMPSAQVIHLMAAALTVLSFLTGILLLAELVWMRRYGITPDSFCPPKETTLNPVVITTVETPPTWKVSMADPRDAVNALRSQGADYGRRHSYAEGSIEKEYLRSMEILNFALADILEAGVRSLDEKKEFGAAGSNTGFRQMEMTRECLARINRIAAAATRSLWGRRKENEKKRLPKRNCRQ